MLVAENKGRIEMEEGDTKDTEGQIPDKTKQTGRFLLNGNIIPTRICSSVFSCQKQLYKRICPSVGRSVGRSGVSQKLQIQPNSRLFATVGQAMALFIKNMFFLG